jgi:hypothetical protein
MRRNAPACALLSLLSVIAVSATTRADETMRTRRAYTVDASLPTPEKIGPNFDPRSIRLVHDALGLVVERKMWLATRLFELTFVSGTKLVSLDLAGRGKLSVEPTGFNSGVVTFATHF